MFIGYKDTQEELDFLKKKGDLNGINIQWLINTLEQMNKRAERYENIISNIANIDTMFMTGDGEDEAFDDKKALEEIERMVAPVWEEVANRKNKFPDIDIDVDVKLTDQSVDFWKGIADYRMSIIEQKERELKRLKDLYGKPISFTISK